MLEGIKNAFNFVVKLSHKRIPCIAFLVAITLGVTTLLGCSVKTFVISDGNRTYTVRSLFADVENALKEADLESKNYKILTAQVGNHSSSIKIAYTFPVYITKGDETVEVEATETTVAELLASCGYTLDKHDMVEPAADTLLSDTAYIDYTDIEYVSGSYTETIPSKTETVYSSKYNKGTEKVEKGTDGLREVNYTAKKVNGKTVETSIDSSVVLTAAVNTKKIVGTKASTVKTSESVKCVSTLKPSSPIELDSKGKPVKFKKVMTVKATAYTYTGNNCSTGVAPQPGYIAVNPKIIPYGTKMYIKSTDGKYTYGYAIAADTGGFVKRNPTNVDLFFSSLSACYQFGARNVEIYILE
ncbi:MAG: G5 domain-containing protein [Clostridia bacterium]|nr:G5 domain-containing protein [Clostridia bacterium]